MSRITNAKGFTPQFVPQAAAQIPFKKLLPAVLLLSALFANNAHAELKPTRGTEDTRVTEVVYDPKNVIPLHVYEGFQITLFFHDTERVVKFWFGDDDAWEKSDFRNTFTFKPKAIKPRTNLTVLTNKRRYLFDLNGSPAPRGQKMALANTVFVVDFKYPLEEALAAKAGRATQSDIAREKLYETGTLPNNRNYWVQGTDSLTPTEAYDDGRFTYLRFGSNKDFPAPFLTADDNSESNVNWHAEGNVLVIERVTKKIVLRKGEMVACIFNDSFNSEGVDSSQNLTVSPDVKRTVKKGAN